MLAAEDAVAGLLLGREFGQVLLPGLSTNALPKVKFKPSKLAIHRLSFID